MRYGNNLSSPGRKRLAVYPFFCAVIILSNLSIIISFLCQIQGEEVILKSRIGSFRLVPDIEET